MRGYLNELKELGALDEEASLTEKGNRIGFLCHFFLLSQNQSTQQAQVAGHQFRLFNTCCVWFQSQSWTLLLELGSQQITIWVFIQHLSSVQIIPPFFYVERRMELFIALRLDAECACALIAKNGSKKESVNNASCCHLDSDFIDEIFIKHNV